MIINADDFGFSREVTEGIIEAHLDGCVTSTTLMANMDAWEYAVEQGIGQPNLSVGIHLTLTAGRPVLPPGRVSSLVDAEGRFHTLAEMSRRAWRLKLSTKELREELAAQIRRLIDAGLMPTHADSHHHGASYPQAALAMTRALKEFGIDRTRTHRVWFTADRNASDYRAARRRARELNLRGIAKQIYYRAVRRLFVLRCGGRTPDQLWGFARLVSDRPLTWNVDDWRTLLANMPSGLTEFVCHPGRRHDSMWDEPEMIEQRTRDLAFVTDPQVIDAIKQADIDLVNFTAV